MKYEKRIKVSDRQIELLTFIKEYQSENKTLPTLAVMSEKMKITIGGVHQKVGALERKGILKRNNLYIINFDFKEKKLIN